MRMKKFEITTIEQELNRIIYGGSITMPKAGDGGKTLIIQYTKEYSGAMGTFKAEVTACKRDLYMKVIEYNNPNVQFTMVIDRDLLMEFDRLCKSEGWNENELPGKIIHITANPDDYPITYNLQRKVMK